MGNAVVIQDSSRPLLSRSGCILLMNCCNYPHQKEFSSPFIEERLYFNTVSSIIDKLDKFSSPFIEERLYLIKHLLMNLKIGQFSSPFIEERLYLFAIKGNRMAIL